MARGVWVRGVRGLKDPLDVLYTSDQNGPYKEAMESLKTTEEARRQETDDPGTETGTPPNKPGMVYTTVKGDNGFD